MENTETQTTTATQIAKKRGRPREENCKTRDTKAYMKHYLDNVERIPCSVCNVQVQKYAMRQHMNTKRHLLNWFIQTTNQGEVTKNFLEKEN